MIARRSGSSRASSAATGSSPVISNAGNANNNPANGSWAPSVMTTGASSRSPNPDRAVKHAIHQLQAVGYRVTLEPAIA
jgi:hypothetical protein